MEPGRAGRHFSHTKKGTIPMRFLACGPAILSILCLVACAEVPTDPAERAAYDSANDPAEPTNRTICAWNTTQRFAINSTIGGAGLFDVASDWDRPHHDADFGQTFGVWGIGTGPSVQLPLFGPSNVRDAVGKAA